MAFGIQRRVCGIDMGTTYSSIAYYDPDKGKVEVVPLKSAGGMTAMPSAVYVDAPDTVLVGSHALKAAASNPTGELMRGFKVRLGDPGLRPVVVGKRSWGPVECEAEVLKVLASEASQFFLWEVKDVVITVPARFNPAQKDLTREAAERAGLNVIGMIEEPQAAALTYLTEEALRRAAARPEGGLNMRDAMVNIINALTGNQGAVLVSDLGGGTFDVALIQVSGRLAKDGIPELAMSTLAHAGDLHLGGMNWDEAIMGMVMDYVARTGRSTDIPRFRRYWLEQECERAKLDLPILSETHVVWPGMVQVPLSIFDVERRTQPLMDRVRAILEKVLKEAREVHMVAPARTAVLMAGGMSYWPAVGASIEQLTGRPPIKLQDLEQLIVRGAAYMAHWCLDAERSGGEFARVLAGDVKNFPGMRLSSGGVGSFYPAIGVEVIDTTDWRIRTNPLQARRAVKAVIPSKAPVGAFHEEEFITVAGHESVTLKFYFLKEDQGRKDTEITFDAWQPYKQFTMSNVRSKAGGHRIKVRIRYSHGGVLDGRAWDENGRAVKIEGKVEV